MSAYSQTASIRAWALIRGNTVVDWIVNDLIKNFMHINWIHLKKLVLELSSNVTIPVIDSKKKGKGGID